MTEEQTKLDFQIFVNSAAWPKLKSFIEDEFNRAGRTLLDSDSMEKAWEGKQKAEGGVELWKKITAFILKAAQP